MAEGATWYIPADEPTGSEYCGKPETDQLSFADALLVTEPSDTLMLCNGSSVDYLPAFGYDSPDVWLGP